LGIGGSGIGSLGLLVPAGEDRQGKQGEMEGEDADAPAQGMGWGRHGTGIL
jgi:hypothetical protein